ncbi:sugar ABC transporter permease [Promicromonospora sukumoe]|uniref:Multiple sugar transport system permease protein n=1 Tax=Promicromonospora sukumoe TaxID=88382 RepID=A0A7W3PFJ6_9MICO|nr:sugar ABC transporter permease [Promicromonospora sukumoe]MBA8810210.1 multiple sugar transport system permease protein [Promicromonospora sukumoe]
MTATTTAAPATGPVAGARAAATLSPSRPRPWTPYLFLAPFLLIFGTFVLVPAVSGLWMSLHNWDFFLPDRPFVGLQNYVDLFTPDALVAQQFWESMRATGLFVVLSVPLLMAIPLGLALLLNQRFRGRTFFRAVFFAPYVLGVSVIGLLWQYLLNGNTGLINGYLAQLGVTEAVPWLTATPWVWISLVGVTVWWTMGFNSVVYLAGLQNVDDALYDAAKVDGANRWQQFVHVTIPQLRPVILFVLTMTVLASANMFGQSYLLTAGNPSNETRTAIMFIAEVGLEQFRMGLAAAMSYLLALLLIAVSALNFLFLRQKES